MLSKQKIYSKNDREKFHDQLHHESTTYRHSQREKGGFGIKTRQKSASCPIYSKIAVWVYTLFATFRECIPASTQFVPEANSAFAAGSPTR
jgi:hypothetical protein